MTGLFVPGWGASAALYRAAMPEGWEAIELPSFRATRGSLEAYRRRLVAECRRRPGPLAVGGHSMGAALAVLVAAGSEPGVEVERLVLVNPAGLPLSKPVALMLVDFLRRLAAGWFPPGEAARRVWAVTSQPRCARRLGRELRSLDLGGPLEELRRRRVPCTVLAASTDTLTPPELCRRIAALAGAEYRELEVEGGHLWFLRAPALLKEQLAFEAVAPGVRSSMFHRSSGGPV